MKYITRIKPISYGKALALLKILALGNREIEEGKVAPAAEVFARRGLKRSRR